MCQQSSASRGTDSAQFRFFDPQETRAQFDPAQNSRISNEEIAGQTDPFYAECRAYGRIRQKGLKRPVAVACHGFISIPATKEGLFAKRFNIGDWDRPEEELSFPPSERQPFRALVKDLVETEPEVTEELVKAMLGELKSLRSMGIYVMDVAWRNYAGGHLVDFSSAWTQPCFDLRRYIRSEKEIQTYKKQDLADFDVMVEEELGIQTEIKAVPSRKARYDLRPRKNKRM